METYCLCYKIDARQKENIDATFLLLVQLIYVVALLKTHGYFIMFGYIDNFVFGFCIFKLMQLS